MKHGAYGSPVLRSQVLMLDDGNPVLMGSDGTAQELLTGRVRKLATSEHAQAVSDAELRHLVQRGVVGSFTDEQVWLTALIEDRAPVVPRPLAPQPSTQEPVFYLHTRLPSENVYQVRDAIVSSGLQAYVYASVRNGIVALTAPGGRPFSGVADAELALSLVGRHAPKLLPAHIEFAEGRDVRRTTTELVAAVVQEDAPELSFDELAASQSASEITRGQVALVVCADPAEQHLVNETLHRLEMQAVMVQTAEQGLEALTQWASPAQISVIVLDIALPESPGWTLLGQLRALPASAPPVIALADAMTLRGAQASSLRTAGVHVLVERPLNAARLRLKVFELLQERAGRRWR